MLQDQSAKLSNNEEVFRRTYLQLRSTVLYERYGIPKEVLCSRSRSVSLRGMNVSSSENKNTNSQDDVYMSIQQMLDHVTQHIFKYRLHLSKYLFFLSIKKLFQI